MSTAEEIVVETWTMHDAHGAPVDVEITFVQFFGDSAKYWRSAKASDGQVVVPGKDGSFEKGDGTLLTYEGGRDFEYGLRHDS